VHARLRKSKTTSRPCPMRLAGNPQESPRACCSGAGSRAMPCRAVPCRAVPCRAGAAGWDSAAAGASQCVLSLAGSRLSATQGNEEVVETAIPCSSSPLFPATDPRAPVFTSSLPPRSAAKQPQRPDANRSARKRAGSHQIKRPLPRDASLALTLLHLGPSEVPAGWLAR